MSSRSPEPIHRRRGGDRLVARALLVVGALATASCDASFPTAPSGTAPVAALRLYYQSGIGELTVGAVFQFTALTLNTDGVYEDVTAQTTWFSSAPLVVAIGPESSFRRFEAVGPGVADITGLYKGHTDSIRVAVRMTNPDYPYLSIIPAAPSHIGGRIQAHLSIRRSDTSLQTVTELASWSSADPGIATVTRGVVTAVGSGTTEITARYEGLSTAYKFSVLPRSW